MTAGHGTAAVPGAAGAPGGDRRRSEGEHRGTERRDREFCRAENEDDDGYDPWSDRRPEPEPLWEEDLWA